MTCPMSAGRGVSQHTRLSQTWADKWLLLHSETGLSQKHSTVCQSPWPGLQEVTNHFPWKALAQCLSFTQDRAGGVGCCLCCLFMMARDWCFPVLSSCSVSLPDLFHDQGSWHSGVTPARVESWVSSCCPDSLARRAAISAPPWYCNKRFVGAVSVSAWRWTFAPRWILNWLLLESSNCTKQQLDQNTPAVSSG